MGSPFGILKFAKLHRIIWKRHRWKLFPHGGQLCHRWKEAGMRLSLKLLFGVRAGKNSDVITHTRVSPGL